MKIIYSDQQIDVLGKRGTLPSIFLAGPTPRSQDVRSWRPEAIKILEGLEFDGVVFVPEWSTGEAQVSYQEQVDWEWKALHLSTAIAAWVPRDIAGGMPAFTTNVEFGFWVKDHKFFYGRPPGADKCSYLDDLYYRVKGRSHAEELRHLMQDAMYFISYKNSL